MQQVSPASEVHLSLILTLRYNTHGWDFFKFRVKPREYIIEYRNNFYHLKRA